MWGKARKGGAEGWIDVEYLYPKATKTGDGKILRYFHSGESERKLMEEFSCLLIIGNYCISRYPRSQRFNLRGFKVCFQFCRATLSFVSLHHTRRWLQNSEVFDVFRSYITRNFDNLSALCNLVLRYSVEFIRHGLVKTNFYR